MSNETLLIRADASAAIGTGHVMRCLALAQAWQDAGGSVVFTMAEATPAVRARLVAESCEVVSIPVAEGAEDARLTVALARERGVQWVVVDGYQFGAEHQRDLKAAGFNVLFLDDYGHASSYCADLVLNQNIGAKEELYAEREPATRLLLGPRYSLLRREFSEWREWTREIRSEASRVLVTMGGSDPQNVTASVIEALCTTRIEGVEAIVVVGGSNPRFNALQEVANQANLQSGAEIAVRKDISNMPELMAWADVAVAAAGSTCWELCLLGLPSLLIDVAANQTALARELGRLGCAIHVGNVQGVSPAKIAAELEPVMRLSDQRRSLSQAARKLVDGFGAKRVISAMRGCGEIYLRRASASDARLLWEWANDPEVRAASFSPAAIPWDTHIVWFEKKLATAECLILIAEGERGIPLGQIRFERKHGGNFEVDISVAKAHRGCGVAAGLIDKGVRQLLEREAPARILARVKLSNKASMRAFEKAGFKRNGSDETETAIQFIYEAR